MTKKNVAMYMWSDAGHLTTQAHRFITHYRQTSLLFHLAQEIARDRLCLRLLRAQQPF